MHLVQHEQIQARELLEEGVVVLKELGDRWSTAETLLAFARVAASQGELKAAIARYQESLTIAREIEARNLIALAVEGIAALAATQGEQEWAARLWGTAKALREMIGAPLPPVYRADFEPALAITRSQLGEDAFEKAMTEGRIIPLEKILDDIPKLFSLNKNATQRGQETFDEKPAVKM